MSKKLDKQLETNSEVQNGEKWNLLESQIEYIKTARASLMSMKTDNFTKNQIDTMTKVLSTLRNVTKELTWMNNSRIIQEAMIKEIADKVNIITK